MKITKSEARKLFYNSNIEFSNNIDKKADKSYEIIKHLGYIQIDTLAVVQRAHHHTFWLRNRNYNPSDLHKLLTTDRKIFEYWGHAASYLPIEDYRYYIPKMQAFHDPMSKWVKGRMDEHKHLFDPMLKRISEMGEVSSKDFKETRPGNGWGDWKTSKTVLELLFWCGELMISRRDKFQKYYDLTERVLPAHFDRKIPTDEEICRFLIKRTLNSYGFATAKEISEYIHLAKKDKIKKYLNEMLSEGTLEKLEVEKSLNEYFTLTDKVNNLRTKNHLHILSPFDNFTIQRNRIKELYNFDYALECYVPQAKRKFGYFVLPILYNNKFVCRIDAKRDKKKKMLTIHKIHFEPKFKQSSRFDKMFKSELQKFTYFNDCKEYKLPNGIKL